MMDGLNKGRHLPQGIIFWNFFPTAFVPRQGFFKHRHQWPIPREKNRVSMLTRLLLESFVATFSPARVFPAPGTPVTRQIDFLPWAFDFWMISSMQVVVRPRFCAPASERAISSTRW